MATDIDSFIRDQKVKLATERQGLVPEKARSGGGVRKGDEEYKAVWSKLHPQKSPRTLTIPLPTTNVAAMKQPEPPETAGGAPHTFDRRIERKLSEMEYKNLWKEAHGGAAQADNVGKPERRPTQKVVQNPQASTITYEEQKKALQAQRKQEMQSFLQQQREEQEDKLQRRQWKEREEESKAIPKSEEQAEAARRRMAEDRKKEYLELKEKSEKKGERRQWAVPETAMAEKPLQLGEYERVHQQFRQERQQDYNKMLQSQKQGNRSWREPSEEKLLPVGQSEGRKKQLERERNREYNEYLKSKGGGNRTWREPSAEKLLPLGDYEQKRRTIEEARKNEYQDFLRKQNTERRNLAQQTDEYKAQSFPGMNESDNAKIEKERERNEEYNQYLKEKNQGRRPHVPADQEQQEFMASLPGLRDSNSAKRHKEQQRNAEYNLYLQSKQLPAKNDPNRPPIAPRNVWATPIPSYDEVLDRKRLQESQYRRTNDPNYDLPLESERKLAELDKELDLKKARLRSERLSQGVLDDPTWLSPRKGSNDARYEELPRRRGTTQEQPSSYYTSLPLGPDSSEFEKKRQQEQYRHDLEKQIQEAADGKQRRFQKGNAGGRKVGSGEKAMDLKVDYSGYIDPEVRRIPTLVTTRRPRQVPARSYQSTALLDSLDKLDQISPRSEVILGRRRLEDFNRGERLGGALPLHRGTARGGGIGAADTGFEAMMDAPRLSSLAPPPGLEYQPASYITQGGTGGLGQSSVDDAYTFYATHNPLVEGAVGGGEGGGVAPGGRGGRRVRGDQEVFYAGGGTSRARMEAEKRFGAGRPMDFVGEEDGKQVSQLKAQVYQEELSRQIEENRRKKMREREERDRYDQKIEQEARDYNPYGRGGGGAPMRDSYGNLVTDLRSMHRENENLGSPRRAPPNPYLSPRGPANIRDDLIGPPPVQTTAEGEQSYARGGHGIFGMPKTDAEKVQSEKYKNDLMRQIEEKKFEEMRKKEKEREEEMREQRKVEEQQRRMQEEYEEERRRTKEKEDDLRRKNEELIRLAEDRRREAERRRNQDNDHSVVDVRQDRSAGDTTHVTEKRPNSPPVPAARTRQEPQPSTSYDDAGPPVRTHSANVLNQLAAMRKQLQNERQRVETMLERERNEPDVFDPRLVQRPPPAPIVRPEIDVFETALLRNAVPVRRTPADRPNTQAVEDFGALKFKDDSNSRKEFRRLFPEDPSTGNILEAQQSAMLRQQEDNLRRLRDQRQYESAYPKTASSNQSYSLPKQLHSNSAFVEVDSLNHFPDDFDDIPTARRDSDRALRRDRRGSTPVLASRGYPDPFGSTTSLNVDRLAKKNEDRLKKLREMQGDDMSLYDPDDVLDRFMSKQAHNRPPSGRTLMDDTWMLSGGSKASGY